MLDRAGIPYRTEPISLARLSLSRGAQLEGSTVLMIASQEGFIFDELEPDQPTGNQPIPGGYSGFFSEIVFGPDGNLLAIWAWE